MPDFQGPAMHDELRYSARRALMQDNAREALTLRNTATGTALPVRRWESFLPGTGQRLLRELQSHAGGGRTHP